MLIYYSNLLDGADMSKQYNVQTVLELACAAQRINNDYVKAAIPSYDKEGNFLEFKRTNQSLIRNALGELEDSGAPKLEITEADKELVDSIRSYYKRLMFSTLADPENQFLMELMTLFNNETIPSGKIGVAACLPSVYQRDKSRNNTSKTLKNCEDGFLGSPGDILYNQNCDVIESSFSKNYFAWNITAIANNKLITWFSKTQVQPGPCIIKKAKIKDHRKHWNTKKDETRLNYVRIKE